MKGSFFLGTLFYFGRKAKNEKPRDGSQGIEYNIVIRVSRDMCPEDSPLIGMKEAIRPPLEEFPEKTHQESDEENQENDFPTRKMLPGSETLGQDEGEEHGDEKMSQLIIFKSETIELEEAELPPGIHDDGKGGDGTHLHDEEAFALTRAACEKQCGGVDEEGREKKEDAEKNGMIKRREPVFWNNEKEEAKQEKNERSFAMKTDMVHRQGSIVHPERDAEKKR